MIPSWKFEKDFPAVISAMSCRSAFRRQKILILTYLILLQDRLPLFLLTPSSQNIFVHIHSVIQVSNPELSVSYDFEAKHQAYKYMRVFQRDKLVLGFRQKLFVRRKEIIGGLRECQRFHERLIICPASLQRCRKRCQI